MVQSLSIMSLTIIVFIFYILMGAIENKLIGKLYWISNILAGLVLTVLCYQSHLFEIAIGTRIIIFFMWILIVIENKFITK